MSEIVLRTDRLIIRLLQAGDLAELAAIQSDPEVMRFMGRGYTFPREYSADFIRRHRRYAREHETGIWAVALPATAAGDRSRLIGTCGLVPCDLHGVAEIEFGYMLGRDYWGRGYATEVARALVDYAFTVLGLQRVIAMTHPDNRASARVIVKAGLRLEQRVSLPKGPRLIFSLAADVPGASPGRVEPSPHRE